MKEKLKSILVFVITAFICSSLLYIITMLVSHE